MHNTVTYYSVFSIIGGRGNKNLLLSIHSIYQNVEIEMQSNISFKPSPYNNYHSSQDRIGIL